MALEYFEFDRLGAKLGEWLELGGIFAFLVAYWWYPINKTLPYGRFPYLLQQLSTEETLVCFSQVHPEIDRPGSDAGFRNQMVIGRRLPITKLSHLAWTHASLHDSTPPGSDT